MTNQGFLIGIGAGLIAALAFASATTGPLPMRFLLYLLTPLPIFLAGLGWGYLSALIASLIGAFALGFISSSPAVGLVFAATQTIPCVVLCYLAGLNRPIAATQGADQTATTSQPPAVEWYPVGRIVLWTAAIATVLSITLLLAMGQDSDQVRDVLRETITKIISSQMEAASSAGGGAAGNAVVMPTDKELEVMTDNALRIMPAIAAISIMLGLLFNLWLGARITHASGQLQRPWPDLAAIYFPPGTALVFSVAILLAFLKGMTGLAATAISGALFAAYFLLGLAIIHYATRPYAWRPFLLWAIYFVLFVLSFLSLLIVLVGLSEPFSPINRRKAAPRNTGGQGPPSGQND